ncbi:aminotransferase class IV [Vallicoccus soli]|uniref:4-amino-4-deoxychorismate lyase n=1 Tax=Vallicoccus soli TaxID=2339232 RepID=A0A3A3YRS3_9ACTN|nr:4-amino-4-deoxychorismate lyase [Vallicoccus soli]
MRVWLDGAVVPLAEARVGVLDHGLTVGDGVFETLKVVDGTPFALTLHLRRLAASAAGLGLGLPGEPVLRRAVEQVLAGPGAPLARLRLTVTGGEAPPGSARADVPPTVVVVLAPLDPAAPSAAAVTVPWPRNERGATAGLKTTSYAENVVALARARAAGASEALLPNTRGRLCEGTGSNVLVEHGGRLVTPPLASGCLAGVTRALVLRWCDVGERDLPVEALGTAGEVALTSSTRDVQPLHALDGRALEPGPLAAAAREEFARRARREPDPV